MAENAENLTGPVWAVEDDLRQTSIGRFLRKFNLDELPQLWNVFKGEMSLVGPRPERPVFVEEFREGIPRYFERHRVKSGMTGWAQVNGLRGNTPIDKRTRYDLYYVENWSLGFDLWILFCTIFEPFASRYHDKEKVET
jgi:lipopolysaccharide/colanic/teichoic acid biosynthesis glycosyltransferase